MGIDGVGAGIGSACPVFASLRSDRGTCHNRRCCPPCERFRVWCTVGTTRSLWSPHGLDCHAVGCCSFGACGSKVKRAEDAGPICVALIVGCRNSFLAGRRWNSPRPRIVVILYQQEDSMRKPLSMGAIAAFSMLISSTAIAVAGSESIQIRHLQLAQIPGDPPVSTKRTVNLNEEDRHTIREIVLKDRKLEKAPENIKVAIGETVPQGVHLQPMPEDVTRKVPQLKNNTYFVKGEE